MFHTNKPTKENQQISKAVFPIELCDTSCRRRMYSTYGSMCMEIPWGVELCFYFYHKVETEESSYSTAKAEMHVMHF